MDEKDKKLVEQYIINDRYEHQDNKGINFEDSAISAYEALHIEDLDNDDRETYNNAKILLSSSQKITLLLFSICLFLSSFANYDFVIMLLALVINLVYTTSILFKYITFRKGSILSSVKTTDYKAARLQNKELPTYSILIPVYKEENVLPNLLSNIANLDYPKEKLQIILILEQDDLKTIEAAVALKKLSEFEMVIVPDCYPKTKPKACNYALKFVKSEYIVVYDADDKPDPEQLRRVVNLFRSSSEDVACIQARLNYYNARENLLTEMFAIEYAVNFNYVLPALECFNMFIPLGGTSNHFKTAVIKQMMWDPYNLTEDADIGVRLKLNDHKVKSISSYTMEEAPIRLKNWLKQRARWNKGFLQTYLVHIRDFNLLKEKMGCMGFLAIHVFFIFGTVSACGSIIMLALLSLYDSALIKSLCTFNVILFFLLSIVSANKVRRDYMKGQSWWKCFLFPFYIIMQIGPVLLSLVQLIKNPSYWDKTMHGITKRYGEFDMNS